MSFLSKKLFKSILFPVSLLLMICNISFAQQEDNMEAKNENL